MQSQGALSSFKPQNVARAVCPRARRKGVGALPTARWGRSSWTTMTTRSGAMTRRSGTRVRDDTRLERAHASQMRASDAGCPDLRVTRHHRRVRLASSYPPLYPPLTHPKPLTSLQANRHAVPPGGGAPGCVAARERQRRDAAARSPIEHGRPDRLAFAGARAASAPARSGWPVADAAAPRGY